MLEYRPPMRTAPAVLALAVVLSWGASRSIATTQHPELVITGATLIDGTGDPPRSGITLVVREGRIAAVTSDAEAGMFEGATVIDAAGKYVIPGLADMHVHFGLGVPLPRRSGTTDEVLARELYVTPPADPVNLYPLGLGISIVRTEEAARSAVRERAGGGMAAIKITVESGPTTFGDDRSLNYWFGPGSLPWRPLKRAPGGRPR